ncbi:Hypothetical predicted protein, partial [Olea europaea subsp. europaea]
GKLVFDRGNGSSLSKAHDEVHNFHFMPTSEVERQHQTIVVKDGPALSISGGGVILTEHTELQKMEAIGYAGNQICGGCMYLSMSFLGMFYDKFAASFYVMHIGI